MDVVLSLLRAAIAGLIGLFIALGSLFTPHLMATNAEPPATTTSEVFPVATSTASTTAPGQMDGGAPQGDGLRTEQISSKKSAYPESAAPVQVSPAAPLYTTEQLNTLARASLVNILCTTGAGGSFNPISGSGVIIDSRGIILTNAHVAQFFLLRDYPTPGNVQCIVRAGSPAQPRYTARLLYLPPKWIAKNAGEIASTTPTGTGEGDYAFLYITGSTSGENPLPAAFPALAMDAQAPQTGQSMLLAAYPAGFLGGITISLSLYPTSAVTTVGQLYSFDNGGNTDLFSLGGTVVSQSGSSGGAAVNTRGKLSGIIATEVPAATTAGRDLRAISLNYIDRSLADDGLGGLTGLLLHNPATFSAAFNADTAPAETKALEDALNKQ